MYTNKIKTSGMLLKARYRYIYQAGYCDLEPILKLYDCPMYYTCGVYGWKYDAYYLGDSMIITTGYRNMIGLEIDYHFKDWINTQARKVVRNSKEAFDLIQLFKNELKNGVVVDNKVYCGVEKADYRIGDDWSTYTVELQTKYGDIVLDKVYKRINAVRNLVNKINAQIK